jgi:prepilin-type N-terminal cleavage/methylation domain-containing protein
MKNKGFTRIELLVVILILGVLSITAIPIYREYVRKAVFSEGQSLLATLYNAQKIYYGEFGSYHEIFSPTSYDQTLDIDAIQNRIFKSYNSKVSNNTDPKTFELIVYGKSQGKDIVLVLKGVEGSDEIEIIEKKVK